MRARSIICTQCSSFSRSFIESVSSARNAGKLMWRARNLRETMAQKYFEVLFARMNIADALYSPFFLHLKPDPSKQSVDEQTWRRDRFGSERNTLRYEGWARIPPQTVHGPSFVVTDDNAFLKRCMSETLAHETRKYNVSASLNPIS